VLGGVNLGINISTNLGFGDILLDGGSEDLVISTPQVNGGSGNLVFEAIRDIVVLSSITTTGSGNVVLNADSANLAVPDGLGGVIIENTGSIDSVNGVTITGAIANADPLITSAVVPAGTGIFIGGTIDSTGAGDVTFNSAGTTVLNSTITNSVGTVSFGDPVDVSGDSLLQTDAVSFLDAVTSSGGDLTMLPSTNGLDVEIGGTFLPAASALNLSGFGGTLNIGGDAAGSTHPDYAGNVTVIAPLSVPSDLTMVSLGDILIDNVAGGSLSAGGTLSLIALGLDATSAASAGISVPAGFTSDGGTILDTEVSVGDPALTADTLAMLAPAAIGSDSGGASLVVEVTNQTEVATNASETFIDSLTQSPIVSFTIGSGETFFAIDSIVGAYGTSGLGLFDDSIFISAQNRVTARAGLQTETGEIGFIDVGLFLLPDAYAVSRPGVFLAALADPDFPGDLRPDDPDDEEEWALFFEEVVREFVASRYLPLPEDASEEAKAERERRITAEMADIITYYDTVRARERAIIAFEAEQQRLLEGGEEPAAEPAGEPPAAEPEPSARLPAGDGLPAFSGLRPGYGPSGYVGESWSDGGIGVEAAWWSKLKSPWPENFG
jgi:hypothetical protein